MRQCVRGLAVLLPLLLSAVALGQAPSYTITDLGASTSTLRIFVTGINRNGEVIGYTRDASNNDLAFRTAPNSAPNLPTDYLGTLGGSGTCGSAPCYSVATGINASGQVVGYSTTSTGEVHGFRTAANQPINPATDDLGSLGGSPDSHNILTEASGINDSGQVVGWSYSASGAKTAFRTAANSAINPATDSIDPNFQSPETSEGFTINSAGDVLGSYLGGQMMYADLFVAYHDGTFAGLAGYTVAPGDGFSNINDMGQVADSRGGPLEFWQNGAYTTLSACQNTPACVPNGANSLLEAVGDYQSSSGNLAFLYDGGKVYDLNSLLPSGSGWSLYEALGINDGGQIVGYTARSMASTTFTALTQLRLHPLIRSLRLPPRSPWRRAAPWRTTLLSRCSPELREARRFPPRRCRRV